LSLEEVADDCDAGWASAYDHSGAFAGCCHFWRDLRYLEFRLKKWEGRENWQVEKGTKFKMKRGEEMQRCRCRPKTGLIGVSK
jgi:hypothetical protein